MTKVVLGPEHDEAPFDRTRQALRDLGAQRHVESWGRAGSQEVVREQWRLGACALVLQSETYVGLSLCGPEELVAAAAEVILNG